MAGAEKPRKRDRVKNYMTVPLSVRTADLPRRAGTAVAMLAIAGTALWLGGFVWTLFVAAVAIGVYVEWWALVLLFREAGTRRTLWRIGGALYCAFGAYVLIVLRCGAEGIYPVLLVLGAVIGTDIGAYFSGRTFGGPKIAPSISPSKTWAGLLGGMIGAGLILLAIVSAWHGGMCEILVPPSGSFGFDGPCSWGSLPMQTLLPLCAIGGVVSAIIAQAGDFFESWMKRRAGVKDSGKLLPGHGGLFDRVDGLLSVSVVMGVAMLVALGGL